MRTGIYVNRACSVTIRATAETDTAIRLFRYNQPGSMAAIGTHKLEAGIYMVCSSAPLEIGGTDVDIGVQSLRGDKDDWPDPSAHVIALEGGATSDSIKGFFRIALDA